MSDTRSILTTTRILWLALLMGQVIFLSVVAVLITQQSVPANPDVGWLLFLISCGLLPVNLGIGYFARMQVYKRGWQEDRITPQAYLQGNVVMLALCEAVSFLALIAALLQGSLLPAILVSAVAMAVQVVNFPTGKPMQPAVDPFSPHSTTKPL